MLMYLALKKAGVPAELHVYATGGHGFGLRPSDHPCSTWPERCEEWMQDQGILPPGIEMTRNIPHAFLPGESRASTPSVRSRRPRPIHGVRPRKEK